MIELASWLTLAAAVVFLGIPISLLHCASAKTIANHAVGRAALLSTLLGTALLGSYVAFEYKRQVKIVHAYEAPTQAQRDAEAKATMDALLRESRRRVEESRLDLARGVR